MWHDVKMLNATASTFLGLAAALVLFACLWWFSQLPFFNLNVIEVRQMDANARDRINIYVLRNNVLPRIKGNFFTVNLNSVRQDFKSVPWVEDANVSRFWPNRLVVSLDEYQPIGTWGDSGQLLSVGGVVFSANQDEAEDEGALPAFFGPKGSEKAVLEHYRMFQTWFFKQGLSISEVRLSPLNSWFVKLTNGMEVELGREHSAGSLKSRVDRLLSVYPQLSEQLPDGIASVDLRYHQGFAIRAAKALTQRKALLKANVSL